MNCFQVWITIVSAVITICMAIVTFFWSNSILSITKEITDYLQKKLDSQVKEKESAIEDRPPEPNVKPEIPKQYDGLVTAIASMIARKNYNNIGVSSEGDDVYTFRDMDANADIVKVTFTPELLEKPITDAAKEVTEQVAVKEITYAKVE